MVSSSKLATSNASSGASRPVHSSQAGVHARLEEVVQRHADHPWQAPLHRPTVEAFDRIEAWRADRGADRPVVLDTGCGTGESTRRLAELHPQALVVGVDQSAARLRRAGVVSGFHSEAGMAWLRAELATFWRLARDARWPVTHQYLLYPNPWPKPGQLQRRWHGHPVFPTVLQLGGVLELRSNWGIYVEEFALALATRGQVAETRALQPGAVDGLTPFERKYAASGHRLWQLRCALTKTSI